MKEPQQVINFINTGKPNGNITQPNLDEIPEIIMDISESVALSLQADIKSPIVIAEASDFACRVNRNWMEL